MLEFSHFDDKQEVSNEGLGTIVLIVIAIGVFLNVLARMDESKQSSEESDKYLQILKKHYPEICKYINANLKDDPFFFTKKHYDMPNIPALLSCLSERLSLLPKVLGTPEPTDDDTYESYKAKIHKYFNGKEIKMSVKSGWYDARNIKDDTYRNGGWLDSAKACMLFNQISACCYVENKIEEKLNRLWKRKIRNENGTSSVNIGDSILENYISACFYDLNADVASKWDYNYGQDIRSTLSNMATHLKSYLIERYGADKIKQILNDVKKSKQ